MLRGHLPIGLKGRLPPTEPESWRMGDAPDRLKFSRQRIKYLSLKRGGGNKSIKIYKELFTPS